MEPLSNLVRDRLKAAQGGDHPDADLLTAFAEQVLPERERLRVLLHLSRCADCRDVLALALPPVTSTPPALDTARRGSWFSWPVVRWGAAFACVVIVGSAVLMRREIFSTGSSQNARYSETAAPLTAKEERTEPDQSRMKEQASLKEKTANGSLAPAQLSKDNEVGRRRQAGNSPASGAVVPSAAPARNDKADRGFAQAGAVGAAVGGMASTLALQKAPTGPPEEAKKLQAPSELSIAERNAVDVNAGAKPQEVIAFQDSLARSENDAPVAETGDKREALGKAKAAPAAPPAAVLDAMTTHSNAVIGANETVEIASQPKKSARESASRAKTDRALSYRAPVSRWTISSDGQLQHSTDSGQTWQPVAIAEKATFRALSANGPDIWVGGAAGLLYHSSDAGAHWTQVKPVSGQSPLTGDIAAIEFTDVYHGKITTASGESWLTEDAGESWSKP
jgi:hypothetical protein